MGKAFVSALCSQELYSLDKFNIHNQRHNEEKSFKCNMCGYECSRNSHLVYHMRAHTGERPFKCEVGACGSAFKVEKDLREHIKHKHSDERPLKCDFPGCLHAAKTVTNLRKHKKLHSDERPFACSHSGCNFRAKRKDVLLQHKANLHCETKTMNCSKCNYSTNRTSDLGRHMLVHETKNQNIPCPIEGCEYQGKHSGALKDHLRRHKTHLPRPLSGFGRYAPTNEALKNHAKTDNPLGRPFQCALCFKNYPTLKRLQSHCFVHTNEKPFQCGHCDYEAATKAQVKHHITVVHPNVQFPFIVHLLDDRECLGCKVTLASAEFIHHCKGHESPADTIQCNT